MLKTLMLVLILISLPTFAERKRDRGSDNERGTDSACARVRAACENAGYTSGRKRGGIGSIRDCVQSWAAGAQIKGVALQVTDPTLKDCLEHAKKVKDKRKFKNGGGTTAPPPPKPGTAAAPSSAPYVIPITPAAKGP